MSRSFTLADAPPAPSCLQDNHRHESLWMLLQGAVLELQPDEMLQYFKQEQDKVLFNVKVRGYITHDERELLNAILSTKLDEVTKRFKQQTFALLEVKSDDDPSVIAMKAVIGG